MKTLQMFAWSVLSLLPTVSSARDLVRPVEDRVVHVAAELPLSPAEAYAWFTEPALLTRWLAPVASVEARVGGPYELFWQPDDRENDSTIGCRVTCAEPGELLAFQWRGPRTWKPLTNGADPLTHVVVTFHATANGTRVHLVHSGWRSGGEWESARLWQERAWGFAFAELRQATAPAVSAPASPPAASTDRPGH